MFGSRYLLLLASLIVLLNVVNTTGNYIWDKYAARRRQRRRSRAIPDSTRTRSSATIAARHEPDLHRARSVPVQAFVVSRIVKYLGMSGAILALPLVALAGYGLIALGAGLAVIRWTKITENATDYSVMNTARQLVWLPTSRDEKYKAKQAIDTFFVRAGDVLEAGIVYAGTTWLGSSVRGFALGNVVLMGAWLRSRSSLLREYGVVMRSRVEAAAGGPPH